MTKYTEFRLLKTPPHHCGYLPDRKAEMLFGSPAASMTNKLYGRLVQVGFRRSGERVYLPNCQNCNACVPIRLKVRDFMPRRKQKRALGLNSDLIMKERPAEMTAQPLELYKKYIACKHREGNMYPASADQFESFLMSSWGDTSFLEFYLPNEKGEAGKLLAVAVTDKIDNALLAVYTFFDPSYMKRSLGVFCILKQIEKAQREKLDYLYLGYWVSQSRKMRYKAEYRPHQLLIKKRWVTIT